MSEKKISYFKMYYDLNDEFRKKHIARMSEKIQCECGLMTHRSNITRHRTGKHHIRSMKEKTEK